MTSRLRITENPLQAMSLRQRYAYTKRSDTGGHIAAGLVLFSLPFLESKATMRDNGTRSLHTAENAVVRNTGMAIQA
jgi:hypothetical protein